MTDLITNTDDLKALCQRLRQHKHIAIDTEFLRDKTYYAQLCLIQVASANEVAVIDPLAENIDLMPFFEILQDEAVLKILHSGRQDLEIFIQLTGAMPKSCYDSQIAAMVCGLGEQVGYDKLVQHFLEIHVDKGMRFTDWSRRPLTAQQLEYARADVIHLEKIYPIMAAQLEESGRGHWIEEEMAAITDMAVYRTDKNEVWRKIKLRGAKPAIVNRLKHLAAWRESFAQSRNIPKTYVLKDEVLLAIASANPRTADDLNRIQNFPANKVKFTPHIIEALNIAAKVAKEEYPQIPQSADKTGPLPVLELLRVLLKYTADKGGIAQSLIATADDLKMIALGQDTDSKAMHGWRHEVFGQYAAELKSGRLALAIKGKAVELIAI